MPRRRAAATDWGELQRELTAVLTQRIYPALGGNSFYASLVARAGLSIHQLDVPPAARAAMAVHARSEAARIVQICMPYGADRELRATVLRGPVKLMGAGLYWFPEAMHAIATREAADSVAQWLRTWLGSSSAVDVGAKFLAGGAEVPAIVIAGAPIRRFDRHSWRCPGVPQYRYWAEIDRETGAFPRYLLPYG